MSLYDLMTEDQLKKLSTWTAEQDRIAVERQKDSQYSIFGKPYTGAIGGDLTYHFTPTSLGLAVSVTHNLTKEEINLTDYENW